MLSCIWILPSCIVWHEVRFVTLACFYCSSCFVLPTVAGILLIKKKNYAKFTLHIIFVFLYSVLSHNIDNGGAFILGLLVLNVHNDLQKSLFPVGLTSKLTQLNNCVINYYAYVRTAFI